MLKNPKTNCFGYDKYKKSCIPLESYDCENCAFYKPWKRYLEDQAISTERLMLIWEERGINYVEQYEQL